MISQKQKHSAIHLWFGTPARALASAMILGVIAVLLFHVLRWGIWDATFLGTNFGDCRPEGACWIFIRERFSQFMLGFYPSDQGWRPLLALLLAGTSGLGARTLFHRQKIGSSILCIGLGFGICSWLLLGGLGLTVVPTSQWGGFLLTVVITLVGTLVALPGGILLALGRRSQLPLIRWSAVAVIEFWRGVPLVSILFMASVMLPFFFPEGYGSDKLLRCLIGVSIFASAYMAEVVRGGLEAIPTGQYEAAHALGLSRLQRMRFVILPQAMRAVLPGIVNTLIGLFKDTSLVLIVGMFDLLGMVQSAATDPAWVGVSMEGYVFAGAVFWLVAFGFSRWSLRLEQGYAKGRGI